MADSELTDALAAIARDALIDLWCPDSSMPHVYDTIEKESAAIAERVAQQFAPTGVENNYDFIGGEGD